MPCGVERVAHIVEEDGAQIVIHDGSNDGRSAKFDTVEEVSLTSDRVSSGIVARTGLVDRETAMRVAAARVEPLREGDLPSEFSEWGF